MPLPPAGQRDYSGVRLTRHALERFVERFGGDPGTAPGSLRSALARTRRLGRNPSNGAVAVLAVHRGRALVAVLQETACLTVLTWNQFLPHLADFGRPHLPRKWSRVLRRLVESPPSDDPDADADHVADSQHGHPRPPRTL
jgi:hypothetical protein